MDIGCVEVSVCILVVVCGDKCMDIGCVAVSVLILVVCVEVIVWILVVLR